MRPCSVIHPLSRLFLVMLFLRLPLPPCAAQEASLNAPAIRARPTQRHAFLGVDRCERCHQAPTPADVNAQVTDFVLLNESKIWSGDVHSRAYQLIDPVANKLSKQICDKLAISDISQAQQCLSCHSNWLKGEDRPPTYQRGVACESCHGPSEHWDVPHSRADWRKKPVADKEALGMIDVRNPIKRAEQCFGCHIGNAAEGKLVTHVMYAAGHPPLPGIEIESFAAQLPRHWRYLDEKVSDAMSKHPGREADMPPFAAFDEFVRENHRYLTRNGNASNELILAHNHRAAAVVLGGVVALRESLELMRDLASEDVLDARDWPELATFDCRTCHHELQVPSWRQERISSVPGRPMISDWPTTLIRLAIRHVTENRPSYDHKLAEFHVKLEAVRLELQRSPFGSPTQIHAACVQLSDWLTTEVVEPVSAKPFDDRAVADTINVLIVIGSTEQHDFDSARQIAWALRVLSCDAAPADARRLAIDDTLEVLAADLRLNLPHGTAPSCQPTTIVDETRQLKPLAIELTRALAASTQYDPDRFREQMQKLRESLR